MILQNMFVIVPVFSPLVNVLICAFIVSLLDINYHHCFDAWVSGRASGL